MTTEIKAHELQKLINLCYEAVDKSSIGPIYIRNDDNSFKVDPVNHCKMAYPLACQAFLGLLHDLSPKDFNMNIEGMEFPNETKK